MPLVSSNVDDFGKKTRSNLKSNLNRGWAVGWHFQHNYATLWAL